MPNRRRLFWLATSAALTALIFASTLRSNAQPVTKASGDSAPLPAEQEPNVGPVSTLWLFPMILGGDGVPTAPTMPAVTLTLTLTTTATTTPTPVDSKTPAPSPSMAATPTLSSTPVSLTITPVIVIPPTNTSTNTPTNTPISPSGTPTDTPETNTPRPTDTHTPTPTDTHTPTPTDTNTPTPTDTNTPTPTDTNTPTPTDTNTPTPTDTNTPTPTDTYTPTPTDTNTPTNTPSPARVRLQRIDYRNPSAPVEGEVVTIVNLGDLPQTMTGWTLIDDSRSILNRFAFPSGFVLNGGATVRVWSGVGTNTATDLYYNHAIAIWNDQGDIAYLSQSGVGVVHTCSYVNPDLLNTFVICPP